MSRVIYMLRKAIASSLMLILSLGCLAEGIVDDPIAAIEPGLELDDMMLPGVLGWLDDNTLLATVQTSRYSKFWERQVVRTDVKSGKVMEAINPGSLVCTNPQEKVAGIMVGSAARLFAGGSQEPEPQLQLFSWSTASAKLTSKTSVDGWNPSICKEVLQKDSRGLGSLAVSQTSDVRYFDTKDTYLRFLKGPNGEPAGVALIRNQQKISVLQLNASDIALEPYYLPFRNAYLLSSGRFVMRGSMARENEKPSTEYPLLTMSKAGDIRREYFRPLFERSGFNEDGATFPYAKGAMVFVSARPNDGGGIYLVQGESIKRVWCVNAGNQYDRQCRATSISMSPDGCHFAYFSKGSDNMRQPLSSRSTLKILPLCR